MSSKIVGIFKPLFDIVAANGISPEQLLGDIDTERLSDLDNPKIRLQLWAEINQEAIRLTGDYTIGLRFAQRIKITHLGTLGFALMSCENLDDAIRLVTRYHPMIVPEVDCDFCETEQGKALRIGLKLGNVEQQRSITEVILAAVAALGEFLLNRPLYNVEAHFNYPAPPYADVYKEVFSIPVLFNQSHSQLVLTNDSILDVKLHTANPSAQAVFKQQCELLLRKTNTGVNVSSKVSSILMHSSGHFPDINEVSSKLFMGERTLRRRLKEEGTTFRRVFDEVRNVLACEYLSATNITVAEIANLLGYTETVNFRRAFVRWNGTTPSDYRAEN